MEEVVMTTDTSVALPQIQRKRTEAGNYFISNYPPFSFWTAGEVPALHDALKTAPVAGTPLGIYVHIPFCRKRCHFCYFKVYTDKNSGQIRRYLSAVLSELRAYDGQPLIRGRKPLFIYFGGGTPSYLSPDQLRELFDGMKGILPWDAAREVAFECEPGTLTGPKLEVLKELGITRLSLGIENFDDDILEVNGRAHRSQEIHRAYDRARALGFDQINIDLIAGMLEETESNWHRCIEKTIALQPDCVTIYQMEVPYNTTIYRQMKAQGRLTAPVADWPTKRRWVGEAFGALEAAGYTVTSAYTAVRDAQRYRFEYRDRLWSGADLLSVGVSSFGHLCGVHYQNEKDFEPYLQRVEARALPLGRALATTEQERMIRELVLRMKLGRVNLADFQQKFGVDVRTHFAEAIASIVDRNLGVIEGGQLRLSREALLRVDTLLPSFFLPRHRGARYT